MNVTTRTGRTLAAAVALGTLGAGLAATGPATAATTTPKPKTVTLKAAQYPRLVDNPGKDNDVIRVYQVPGVTWEVDDKPVAFTMSYNDVKVTDKSKVTAAATTGDTTPYELALGTPGQWKFEAPSAEEAPKVDGTTAVVTWNDLPGSKRDTVTLTKVVGVTYTLKTGENTRTVDADAFGTKTTLTLPATTGTTVEGAASAGYAIDDAKKIPTYTNTVTDTDEVLLTTAMLNTLISAGENPLDATKGYGPGSAVETVRVVGVPGVKFKVGDRKAVAVSGVAYLPVDPDDLKDNKVTVTVEAGKGYKVEEGYKKEVDFKDGDSAPKAVVTNDDVSESDKGGISADTLTIKPSQGMTWWVGQADKGGKIKYVAQKPGKGGVITYKVKHASKPTDPAEKAAVYVKAVANRGWLVDTEKLTTTKYDFTRDSTSIPADNIAATETAVTLKPYEGIVSWAVKYTATVGTKTATKTLTVKPVDVRNAGATSMTISFPDGTTGVEATPKLAKDYVLAE